MERTQLILILLAAAALIFVVFQARGGTAQTSGADIGALVRDGARVVDVRTPAEYSADHYLDAINVPLQQLPRRIADVGRRDEPIVIYCASGRRSAAAVSMLRDAGYTNVHDGGGLGTFRRVANAAR